MVLNTNASGSPPASAVHVGADGLVAVARHDRHGAVERRGPDLDQQVGQPVDADLAGRRPDHDGEHRRVGDAVVERVLELVDRGDVAVEVALEHGVVGHDDALDQVVVDLVLELLHLVGDLLGVRDPVLVDVRRVGEQVGDAPEVGLGADGQLEGGDAGAEAVAELRQRDVEARPLAIELVDEHHAGDAEVAGHLPRLLGLHLDPVERADHEHRQVGDAQRGGDLAHEVGVARGVDEVDLVVAPLERARSRATARCRACAPRGRSRTRSCRPRRGPCGGSPRPGGATPRRGSSSRLRCARRGRRCGCDPSRIASPGSPSVEIGDAGEGSAVPPRRAARTAHCAGVLGMHSARCYAVRRHDGASRTTRPPAQSRAGHGAVGDPRRHDVRRTVAQHLREGPASHRWPDPAHRHHGKPTHDHRAWSWARRRRWPSPTATCEPGCCCSC